MGLVRRQDLHRVLGDLWGIGFCDLTRIDLDEHLVRRLPPSEMAAEGWVPIDRRGNVVWVATAEPPDPRVAETLSRELEMEIEVQFLATTEWDVNAVLREVFADRLADEAANALYDRNPLASARHGLTRGQRVTLLTAAMVTAAGFTWNPVMAGIVLCSIANLGFLTAVAFKLVTALAGWRSVRHGVVAAAARIPDDELPRLHRAGAGVPGGEHRRRASVGHLARARLPAGEARDPAAARGGRQPRRIEAARAAGLPDMVKIVVVPTAQPQTKPKACNIGLDFATASSS